jgi:hypothetical protein
VPHRIYTPSEVLDILIKARERNSERSRNETVYRKTFAEPDIFQGQLMQERTYLTEQKRLQREQS